MFRSRSRSRSLASRSTRERLPLQLKSSFGSGCAVIDHGGPQVSNNLSWHFIQAAALTKTKEDPGSPERGSKPGQAWAPPSMLDVFQHNFNFFFKKKIHTFSRCSAWKPAGLLQTNRFSNYFKINSQSLEAGRARTHRWMLGRAPIRLTRSAI